MYCWSLNPSITGRRCVGRSSLGKVGQRIWGLREAFELGAWFPGLAPPGGPWTNPASEHHSAHIGFYCGA